MNKLFSYLFILFLISNCSFVKTDVEEEKKNKKNIFKINKPIEKELNSKLRINLNKITKGDPFFGNYSNNSGNINFETEFSKKSKYNFSSIKHFESTQPELIFTNDNGIVFFDGKGRIFKVNEELKEIWKINYYTKKEKKLDPILYFAQNKNILVVTDTLSKLYSIDLNSGKLLWSKRSLSPFNSNIMIFKDRFITIDLDNVIRSFSIKNGKEFWNFKTENSFIKSQKKLSLVIKGEVVYFLNNLGDITALNINDGSLVWQTPTQSNLIYQNAFSLKISDMVFSNNSIYFSNNKNEIFSIDASSGIIKWKQSVNSSLRPTVIENFVLTISEEGFLFVIEQKTGNILRISNALTNIKNKNYEVKPIGFVLAKNKIYLSLSTGRLVKIDLKTGLQENIFKLHGSKISRPYVFNGSMYLSKDNAIIKTY